MALRGTPDQIALAGWLVDKLDAPASSRLGANEYRMSGGSENVVRIFYLPPAIALADFQQFAVNEPRRAFDASSSTMLRERWHCAGPLIKSRRPSE
jgi:hypothetical protein